MMLVLLFLIAATALLIWAVQTARVTRPHLSSYDVDVPVHPTVRATFFALDESARRADEMEYEYEVAEHGRARLVITDVTGRLLATVLDGDVAPGRHRVNVDLSTLPAGTYLYLLETPTEAMSWRVRVGS